jgi:hypothetical protein
MILLQGTFCNTTRYCEFRKNIQDMLNGISGAVGKLLYRVLN